ncbi:MAG: ABC transporter permease [Dysgonomonas sp.]|nr:ABC transporter permease [Dysgonomonas sp.]
MFDFDSFREIGATIRKNKLRTFLTGFSVAWGIFILIVLLGAGNGLRNGIESNFARRAKNTVSVWPGITTIPYKGLPVDRSISFDQKDIDLIKRHFPEVDHLSAQISQNRIITYGRNYGSWSMRGVHPDAAYINNINTNAIEGRFINNVDIEKKRKVIVINTEMADVLFQNEKPLGKYVVAQNIAFQIVGVYEDEAGNTNVPCYIPFTTAQSLYNKNYGFGRVDFTISGIKSMKDNDLFIERYREKMSQLHNFDPKDKAAISIWNTAEQAIDTAKRFNTITYFIWAVGIFSLIAGIVGIGNIMLITVKERTKEFGIRKAIGASPISILKLVLLESILITAIFGYIGMMLGIGLTELVNYVIEMINQSAPPNSVVVFKNPTVDIMIVLQATAVLIFAGVIAGGIPAVRAVSISPVEAMRSE